jgi:hypothetical protein
LLKAKSFHGFAKICRMIEQGDHLERDGLETIILTAYGMNPGKRRYLQTELLSASGEVKG